MFKKYSSANEIAESFEISLANEYSKEETLLSTKKDNAINYLKEAKDLLNKNGLYKQSRDISLLLTKMGVDAVIEEDWEDDAESEDVDSDDETQMELPFNKSESFVEEVKRVAQKLAYDQDVSDENQLLVAAAKLYLEYQNR